MIAGNRTLYVERWTPFKHVIEFQRLDFLGKDARIQVRRNFDRSGPPLIDLGIVASGEGITISPGSAPDMISTNVEIRINETTIEAMPFTNPRGGEWHGVWDLHIGTGAAKRRWLQGPFIIKPGATQ
jgi:hypothetical protein